jgi:hypothetical protein
MQGHCFARNGGRVLHIKELSCFQRSAFSASLYEFQRDDANETADSIVNPGFRVKPGTTDKEKESTTHYTGCFSFLPSAVPSGAVGGMAAADVRLAGRPERKFTPSVRSARCKTQ